MPRFNSVFCFLRSVFGMLVRFSFCLVSGIPPNGCTCSVGLVFGIIRSAFNSVLLFQFRFAIPFRDSVLRYFRFSDIHSKIGAELRFSEINLIWHSNFISPNSMRVGFISFKNLVYFCYIQLFRVDFRGIICNGLV